MNIRPQEVTVDGERSVRYKGSDGKMHDIAAVNGEADGGSTAQEPLIIDASAAPPSGYVCQMLQAGREVLYIIYDGKYTHYSRNVSIYDDGEPEVHILTPGGTYRHYEDIVALF